MGRPDTIVWQECASRGSEIVTAPAPPPSRDFLLQPGFCFGNKCWSNTLLFTASRLARSSTSGGGQGEGCASG